MASSIRSSELSRKTRAVTVVAVAVVAATAITAVASGRASAQPRREAGVFRCSVRAETPASPAREAETADERRAAGIGTRAREREREDRGRRLESGEPVGFSVSDALNVDFRTRVRGSSPGSGRVHLKLYTPRGHLYQKLPVTFVEERGARSSHRRQGLSARATLPVAGTAIVTNSLYGQWKALVYVEGSDEPCSPPYHFVLDP